MEGLFKIKGGRSLSRRPVEPQAPPTYYIQSTSLRTPQRRRAVVTPGSTPRKQRRAVVTPGSTEESVRLFVLDVNSGQFVDMKSDKGRAIRYHRLRHRLRLDQHDAQEAVEQTLAGELLDLAAVLFERGFVDKMPVSRAADVCALRDAKEALEKMPSLSGVEGKRARMAFLLVAHQLWTPSRMRAFIADVVARRDEALDDPLCSWCERALTAAAPTHGEAEQRELALENEVFTGQHRTRTTPKALVADGWLREWEVVMAVAGAFVRRVDAATAQARVTFLPESDMNECILHST